MTELEKYHLQKTILTVFGVDIRKDWWQAKLDPEKAAEIEGFIDGYGYRCTLDL